MAETWAASTCLAHVHYIHPRPISFPDSEAKANWINYEPDSENTDYYDVIRKSVPRATNILLLFATWTESWVGKPALSWQNRWWHCWGLVLLKNPGRKYGKHLLLFDCEANMNQDFQNLRPREFMLGTQVTFINWARQNYDIQSVWYGNAGITAQESQCVRHTVE